VRITDRVRVSVTVYLAVYSIYGKFDTQTPSRHCYDNFSGTPQTKDLQWAEQSDKLCNKHVA